MKCLFLFSALNTTDLVKFRSFPPHTDIFYFFFPFLFLPFYHFSNEDVLKLTEEEKENKKCMEKKLVILRPKGTKKK